MVSDVPAHGVLGSSGICLLLDGVRPGARLGKDIGRDCQALALGKTASGQGWGALPGLVPRDTGLVGDMCIWSVLLTLRTLA